MNTVKKGDKFEDRVFSSISDSLKSGSLGLNPDFCNLFQKKGYYSRDRDSEIVVDISIEVWMPKANKWSFLLVCECKDYSRPIPVDDIEEFKAKLKQITGVNVKGLFVTSSAYQKGAMKYAGSNGIGLLRLLPEDQIDHVLYSMTFEQLKKMEQLRRIEYKSALINQNHITEGSGLFAIYKGRAFDDWEQLLKIYFQNLQ